MKTFLVIETYKPGKTAAIYERFSKKGRMMPQKVEYVDSWVEENLQKCYQVMKSEGLEPLLEWVEQWKDLVDFEIIPVLTSSEAAKRVQKEQR